MSETRKIFVLDTSVVIHDPQCIQTFGDNDIVVPLALISELDGFKTGDDQKGFNAREFSRLLDKLKEEHETLLKFVPLAPPATGGVCISGALEYVNKVPLEFDQARKDREIIATALRWATENKDRQVILVSKDTNVRLMGHACGLVTEDYKRGKIKNLDQLTHNATVVTVEDSHVDRLMREGWLPLAELGPAGEGLRENQCLTLLGNGESHSKSALASIERLPEGIMLRRLIKDECRLWTLMPRNREQIFASSLLRNPSVKLVSLVGKAGTGKTLLAMAAGLDQVLEPKRRLYRKIVVMRPMVSVGKEMGWLPGDVNEKIHPWMKPIFDNVQFLLGDERKEKDKGENGHGPTLRLQQLLEQGVIELEALSFVRGRSINDAFIVIDEAQNLTPHEMKTLMTRAAGKSKVVLTGDLQQIDTPYLDAHSSGLTHVVKKFGNHPIAGHVTLVKGERSELAELAADLLLSGNVAIVVVGDEILQGRRMEANAAWLSRELFAMGVPLAEVRIVSDTPGALVAAIAQLRAPGRTLICTGGLGPTRDDRTRAEAAEAFGRNLVRSEEALSQVAQRYAHISRPLDEASYRQADIPEGARIVRNPAGTAPSFLLESGGFRLICLPGVPREMRAIFDQTLRSELAPLSDPPGIARLFTHGLGESEQESRMRELDLGEAEFCSLPGPFGVEIQVLARGSVEGRQERADALLAKVATHLGDGVVQPPGATLRQALLAGLRERGWRLAFAESCTAGMAAAEFAAEPGVSEVLWGGIVAYSNELKRALLAVSEQTLSAHGAVSRETALEMARGAAILAGDSGLGLSVTGVAGPSGGTPEKPVGLVWIAASGPRGEIAEELHLLGSRDEIRQRAAWRLIGMGWKMVSVKVETLG